MRARPGSNINRRSEDVSGRSVIAHDPLSQSRASPERNLTAADPPRFGPNHLCVMSVRNGEVERVQLPTAAAEPLDLAVPPVKTHDGPANRVLDVDVLARPHVVLVGVLTDSKSTHVAVFVLPEPALFRPSLGHEGQFVVPGQLMHVGGRRLRDSELTPGLFAAGNPRTELIVQTQNKVLFGRGQVRADRVTASRIGALYICVITVDIG